MPVCRLCLVDHKTDANSEIFKVHETRIRIKIMACTSLEIDEEDDMPQTICTDCRLRLEEYYHFRRRCQAADRRLRLKNKRKRPDCDINEEEDVELNTDIGRTENNDNAQWRHKAAQLIRVEVDAYKKKLLSVCKRQMRQEIEEQIRAEVEVLMVAEAKKQCRVNVLDELFCELERLFIRKRNEAEFGNISGSEGYDGSEIDTALNSTQIGLDATKQLETDPVENIVPPAGTADVVELIDDSSSDQDVEVAAMKPETAAANQSPALATPSAITPVTMVEINMQDTQLSHLREDLNMSNFLKSGSTSSPVTAKKAKRVRLSSLLDQSAAKSPTTKVREPPCRKHNNNSKQNYSSLHESLRNCVRCRLRGADKLNEIVS